MTVGSRGVDARFFLEKIARGVMHELMVRVVHAILVLAIESQTLQSPTNPPLAIGELMNLW